MGAGFRRDHGEDRFVEDVMASDRIGFAHPILARRGRRRRALALAELMATVALALSLLVAVTAVSIGIARAETVIVDR
jgi:hypothetical protein